MRRLCLPCLRRSLRGAAKGRRFHSTSIERAFMEAGRSQPNRIFQHPARIPILTEARRMTLHISEAEVQQVLTMPMALEAVEEISRKQAADEVIVHPRRRFELPSGGFFHYMAAVDYSAGFLAMKQYTFVRGKMRFLVPLYEITSGDLLAMIEADYMGQLRTVAASGVATKYLARRDASVAAIIGNVVRA